MPEATCHGVLPWRAPPGQRRRIFSLRYHIQHGELRPYREKKGIVTVNDFPEWQQVRLGRQSVGGLRALHWGILSSSDCFAFAL